MGKARILKSRLQSYKSRANLDKKTLLMLSQARSVKWTFVETELDAVLSEAELIRVHQPKYNIRLKDDKTPIYIVMTVEDYPRVLTVRKTQLPLYKRNRGVFGPYASAVQTMRVLRVARGVFPFCNASEADKKRKRACFFSHINLCPGACTGKVSKTEYAKNIRRLSDFLRGKRPSVIRSMERQMNEASRLRNYEEARLFRDQLSALRSATLTADSQEWLGRADRDPSRLHSRIGLFTVLAPFMEKQDKAVPKEPYKRIEAYDISNIKGKFASGSMVVFADGRPDREEYRRFRIRLRPEPNDPQMIRETIERRMKHGEWHLPDLMIVDGGKGQVKAARKALAATGSHHRISVVGIAKRLEEIVVYKQSFHLLRLPKDSPTLLLLMHIRDEAHRFAKSYHTFLRRQAMTATNE